MPTFRRVLDQVICPHSRLRPALVVRIDNGREDEVARLDEAAQVVELCSGRAVLVYAAPVL